jgi:hypothetical protein
MQFTYLLSGGAPVIKKYKAAAAMIAGIIALTPASAASGITTSTTTSFLDSIGLTLDPILRQGAPVAFSTVQGADEYLQSVIINPDAVLRALMVGSSANAALEQRVVGTASSAGLTVVGTAGMTDPSSPDMVNGTVWYNGVGSNGGISRRITSTTTALTVTVTMPFAANKIGDNYITVPYSPGIMGAAASFNIVTMSTNLLNVQAQLAITGAKAAVVDIETNGTSDSYLHLIQVDHIFSYWAVS